MAEVDADDLFLTLDGKTSKLIKILKPGQRMEQLYEQIHGKGKKAYFAFSRLHPGKPARTVVKDSPGIFHWKENRTLTIKEYKTISSFPSQFRLGINSFRDGLFLLGNAVPPLFSMVIAANIAELLSKMCNELRFEDFKNYAEFLDAAWELHLAPREPDAPTIISLFAGCGGSSLGYSMAGYRELLAVDFDEKCAKTFKLNFPGIPFHVGDIRELTAERMLELAGIGGGELDVLDGSPPCQGFSTAGKRDLWDPRNELYNDFARLLEGSQPKAFVMENVSGMVKGKMKLKFADCTRKLKAAGYRVSCRLLNAKWFNVPQSRERLIWIGVREDLGTEPSHPKAKSKPISVSEAIGNPGRNIIGCKNDMHFNKWRAGDIAAPAITASRAPTLLLDDGRKRWHLANLPSFTIGAGRRPEFHSASVLAQWEKQNRYIGSFQSVRLEKKKTSPTQIGAHRNWHFTEARQLTDQECARIQSFPDAFRFSGNKSEVMRQIGNSVPPLMAESIGRHVLSFVDDHIYETSANQRAF